MDMFSPSLMDHVTGRWYRTLLGTGVGAVADLMGVSKADQKKAMNLLSEVPVVGDILKADAQAQYMDDYMENKGLSWEDVQYPALLNYGNSSLVNVMRSGTNFVSKNIEELYK